MWLCWQAANSCYSLALPINHYIVVLSNSFLKLSGGCSRATEQNNSEKLPGKAEVDLQLPDPPSLWKLQAAVKTGHLGTKQTVMLLYAVPCSCKTSKYWWAAIVALLVQRKETTGICKLRNAAGASKDPQERGAPSSFWERAVLRKSSTNLLSGKTTEYIKRDV